MPSGPEAMKSSRPILATPNQGRRSRAIRRAATRSSRSRATASRSRRSVTGASARVMGGSYQIAEARDTMPLAPSLQLGQHTSRRPRVPEGGRPHLHGVGTSEEKLDGVLSPRDASDPDDGRLRKR